MSQAEAGGKGPRVAVWAWIFISLPYSPLRAASSSMTDASLWSSLPLGEGPTQHAVMHQVPAWKKLIAQGS